MILVNGIVLNEQVIYQIGISLIKGIGPKLARNLIAYVGNVEEVFKQPQRVLEKIPGIGTVLSATIKNTQVLERAKKEADFINKHGIQPLFFTDENYPHRLTHCDDAPLMLYLKGKMMLEQTKVLGVVGTRRPTQEGKWQCEQLIQQLSDHYPDVVIVSGLAYGVDICAHRAAVKNNLATYGVLAHGLDRIYPGMHRQTATQMLQNGGVVTEFLSETNPDKPNFVRRNRIVAGLCDAVIVVESGIKGGALITARIAQSYHRDVLAFPGSPLEEVAKGCNYLIKKNIAALIEGVEDLEYALGWEVEERKKSGQITIFNSFNSKEEEQLYTTLLENKELTANELSVKCCLPVSKVSAGMLSLEFAGLVKCLPGNAFRLLK